MSGLKYSSTSSISICQAWIGAMVGAWWRAARRITGQAACTAEIEGKDNATSLYGQQASRCRLVHMLLAL